DMRPGRFAALTAGGGQAERSRAHLKSETAGRNQSSEPTSHPDKGTPVVRRVRKARGLQQTAQIPKEMNHMSPHVCPRSIWDRLLIVLLALLALAALTAAPTFAAQSGSARAVAARRLPAPDRALASAATLVRRCQRAHPKSPARCAAARRALQRSGSRLAGAQAALTG